MCRCMLDFVHTGRRFMCSWLALEALCWCFQKQFGTLSWVMQQKIRKNFAHYASAHGGPTQGVFMGLLFCGWAVVTSICFCFPIIALTIGWTTTSGQKFNKPVYGKGSLLWQCDVWRYWAFQYDPFYASSLHPINSTKPFLSHMLVNGK